MFLDVGMQWKPKAKRLSLTCSASARAAGIEPDSKCVVTLAEHIYDVIENEATAWAADVVVIGTHGRRGHTPSAIRQRRGGPYPHFEQAGAAYSGSLERKKSAQSSAMGCTGGAHVRSVARNRHRGASAHSASALTALTWMSSQDNCAKVWSAAILFQPRKTLAP